MNTASYWISRLYLQPHPEGGFYRESYRSYDGYFPADSSNDKENYVGFRNYSTAIYYLLESGVNSSIHRIKSDELWHFYHGSSVTFHQFKNGFYERSEMGPKSGRFQVIVPADTWFGLTVDEPDSFVLLGATVSPGYHFDDLETAEPEELIADFPQNEAIIRRLTEESTVY